MKFQLQIKHMEASIMAAPKQSSSQNPFEQQIQPISREKNSSGLAQHPGTSFYSLLPQARGDDHILGIAICCVTQAMELASRGSYNPCDLSQPALRMHCGKGGKGGCRLKYILCWPCKMDLRRHPHRHGGTS